MTIGVAVPPVADGDFGCIIWYCEILPDAIATTTVTTEVGAILPTMRIGGVNDFVACR